MSSKNEPKRTLSLNHLRDEPKIFLLFHPDILGLSRDLHQKTVVSKPKLGGSWPARNAPCRRLRKGHFRVVNALNSMKLTSC